MSADVATTPDTLGGGRYQLGEVLGTGGMASVRRGTDTVLGRPVAVKVFRADMDEEGAHRAQVEMQTLASLGHPGLVSVYDAGTQDVPGAPAVPYLVMELVDGPTLGACCTDGSLTPERIAGIGSQLADALHYVHSRGVIHRDVKPANILLAENGPKLADFGIARIVDGARHTGTGLTIGTAPYLSPEQVTGSAVGPPTDVYALGLVLLEALTGHREYDGGPVECALARLHRAPVVPRQLPTPWPELLTAMTARDPSMRPTALQVADALRSRDPAPTLVTPVPAGGPGSVRTVAASVPGAPSGARPGGPRTQSVPLRSGPSRPRGAFGAAASELLRTRPARGALVGVLCLLVLVGVLVVSHVGSGASSGAAADPTSPASPAQTGGAPLDRDITDLTKAVTP